MILRSTLLSGLDWLDHGFGTRHAPLLQQGMASLKQIHSAVALEAVSDGPAGEGDALITRRRGLAVSVRTADCYPILLADARTRTVAAVHAGWRGTAARIVLATIAKMGAVSADLYVVIGPGIGVCCYEVGADVARLFGSEAAGNIDLAAANRTLLLDAGVPEGNIEILGEILGETLGACTRCDPARFHSYRRDGAAAGRMISYIRSL